MKLHAESAGAGEPVVILHGLMGSCENWRSVRAALADRYRVVCLDLPNHGKSPQAAQTELGSIGDDVLETLRAQGIDGRVFVIGHSMGGKVAMQMASSHADRVHGLVVVDISPRAIQPVHLFVLRACQQLDLAAAGAAQRFGRGAGVVHPASCDARIFAQERGAQLEGKFAGGAASVSHHNYRTSAMRRRCSLLMRGPALFRAARPRPFRLRDDEELIRGWFLPLVL